MPIIVSVTAIVIEDDQILLLDQDAEGDRWWSLPGGKAKPGAATSGPRQPTYRE